MLVQIMFVYWNWGPDSVTAGPPRRDYRRLYQLWRLRRKSSGLGSSHCRLAGLKPPGLGMTKHPFHYVIIPQA